MEENTLKEAANKWSIGDCEEFLKSPEKLKTLAMLGITEKDIKSVLKEKKINRLVELIFNINLEKIASSREVTVFEYDVLGQPKTQNAMQGEIEGAHILAMITAVTKILDAAEAAGIDMISLLEKNQKKEK